MFQIPVVSQSNFSSPCLFAVLFPKLIIYVVWAVLSILKMAFRLRLLMRS